MKSIAIIGIWLFIATSAFSQKKELAQIKTSYGEIIVWLYDETPIHKASFIKLAKAGYWDSLTINRVVPNFVIQGGCPDTKEGFTDPDYLLAPEFLPSIRHEYGSFAAGRDDNPKMLSASCQFYIVQQKQGLKRLDDKYTVFGKVISGMDVVEKIVQQPRDKRDQPLIQVTMDVNIIKWKQKKINRLKSHVG